MKKFFLFFLLTTTKLCAGWTAQEVILQSTVMGLFIADGCQSYMMLRDGYVEINPILGKHPRVWKLGLYWSTCCILHTSISIFLKKKLPSILPVWQGVFIGIEGHAVYKNFRLSFQRRF